MTSLSIGQSWRWLRNPYGFLDAAREQQGPTFRLRLPVVGNALVTGDPSLVEATAANKALIGGRGTRALRPVLGEDSLIVLEDGAHAAHRRLLAPAFHGATLDEHDEFTRATAEHAVRSLPARGSFSIADVVRQITLRVIARILFGELQSERLERLLALTDRFMRSFRSPAVLFVKALHFDLGRLSPWGRLQDNRRQLIDFTREEIARRRRGEVHGNDVLTRMVTVENSGEIRLSDDAIVSEVLTLLLFGHDTTAAAMAWAFLHIYADRGVVDRLEQERSDSGDPARNPYLRACVNESLRLCPVVVHLTRVASRHTELDSHVLRRDDRVLPCAYLAHRDASVFEAPERFVPERFLAPAGISRWSWFPFGIGARRCLGEQLALRQMQIILGTFAGHADLELDPAYVAEPVRSMLLIVPAQGTLMRLRGRRG